MRRFVLAFMLLLLPFYPNPAKAADIVPCLKADTLVQQHFHAQLLFFFTRLEGEQTFTVLFPPAPRIGIDPECTREIHTHDPDGIIHFESHDKTKTFTIGNALDLIGQEMGEPIKNFDHTPLLVVVSGTPIQNYRDVVIKPYMLIVVFAKLPPHP